MKLNLLDIWKYEGGTLSVAETTELPSLQFLGTPFSFPKPATVNATVQNVGGRFSFQGTVTCDVVTRCARCGEKATLAVHADISETFTNQEADEDMISIRSAEVDVTDILVNSIIESLPEKCLCTDDCKGLCPVCGMNRNNGSCDCEQDDGDPRLEIFRTMAKKDEV